MFQIFSVRVILLSVALVLAQQVPGWSAPITPYAAEVIDYVEGSGVGSDFLFPAMRFNNPQTALGHPTVDTTGDSFATMFDRWPVVPVYPPFRASELVSVGRGGQLTVRFDHPVLDDPLNPFGLDLIIFGNTFISPESGGSWDNGDPNQTTVRASGFGGEGERGIVQVSQDGSNWFEFGSGPFADSYAPTLGRIYDPANADTSVFMGNQWWAGPTDATIPLDPGFSTFSGQTLAQVAESYGLSAGGTGFNIGLFDLPTDPLSGMKWIEYVRVSNPLGAPGVPEIDAFADVSAAPAAVPAPGLPAAAVLLLVAIGQCRRRLVYRDPPEGDLQ